MDIYKSQAASMGTAGTVVACLCGCGMLALFVTMTVYFSIYAFANPDEQAYYISGSAMN